MSIPIVNEKSTFYLSITFKDKDGKAVAPTSATYRVDDVDSGTSVLSSTSISPAATVELKFAPTETSIIDSTNVYEKRKVTVTANYGTNDSVTKVFFYNVRNLEVVT